MMAPLMAAGTEQKAVDGNRAAFLGWCALAVLGQAAQLGITKAGPFVTYQHIRMPEAPGATWWGCVAVLAFQALLVLFALFAGPHRRWSEWGTWLARQLKPWQFLALASVLVVSRAKIARPPEAYVAEIAVSSVLALLALATWILAAQAMPRSALDRFDARVERLLGRTNAAPQPGGPDRFAWTVAAFAALTTALLAYFVYERHPHVPEAFDVDLMLQVGTRWFSPVPPGWPIALAAGAYFGVAWLVNPLLSGLSILLAYAFVRELCCRRSARLFVLLLALSPWFLFLGMSFMTHTWTNCCALLAALGVARARRTKPVAWTLLAGVGIGIVSWIRPLDGLVLAGLLGLWSIGFGGARLPWRAITGLIVSTAAVGALVLPYNKELTGNPMRHPIMDYVDRVYGPGKNDLGFGPDKGLDWGGLDPWPGHTPFQALVNSQFNVFALDAELFGWSAGAMLILGLAFLWSPRRQLVRICGAAILAIVCANGLYWFSGGPDFGARYWYMAIVPCILLACASFEALRERLTIHAPRAQVALALACFSALVTFIPWRSFDKYFHYRGMQPGIRELADANRFGRSVVLIRGERHPDYASAMAYNPLDWEADAPIYAWDRGIGVRKALFAHYTDRPVWIVNGPTRTGRGFEIVAGPFKAEEVEYWESK